MQRVLELVFRPTRMLAHSDDGASRTVRMPDARAWVSALAGRSPLAQARHDQSKFTTELHHCDDPPSGDPAWQCLVLDAGARRFAIAVHDFCVLPGVRVRSWEPVALARDQLPDFAGQCGDVPWRAEIERHWWRLDLNGEPLTVSLDVGVLSAPVSSGIGGEQRAFVEWRISLELADVDNPDDAAPDEDGAPDTDARVELARRALDLFDLARALDEEGAMTLVEHDALTQASQPDLGPQKAGPIEFGSRRTYAAVAAGVMRNIFAQWMANAPGVATGHGSEYVHQMRIALRRMRTAYRFFGEELRQAALAPEKHELKWIGGLLGDVRDWDVLVEETFPSIMRAAREEVHAGSDDEEDSEDADSRGNADADSDAGAPGGAGVAAEGAGDGAGADEGGTGKGEGGSNVEGAHAGVQSHQPGQSRSKPLWDAAYARVAAHREQAAQVLREALASPRYAWLVVLVARQVAVLVARAQARRARPLVSDARKALRKRYRKLAQSVDLRSLSAHDRHQLRIDAKRLRYAIEFLAPALESRPRRRMASHASSLQDALGAANDAIVGRRFLATVELDEHVRMFCDGFLSATESHGVASGIAELDRIKRKK